MIPLWERIAIWDGTSVHARGWARNASASRDTRPATGMVSPAAATWPRGCDSGCTFSGAQREEEGPNSRSVDRVRLKDLIEASTHTCCPATPRPSD